ncbi:hypothetical protein LAZ67_16001087 [Cordylochernes scorpioides]|uniref:Peptidase S1 domain-containing protein n=1 Tax=Cordylochernes scorpioides TaxID=51811 RepID=A0ABY6LBZ5_9ARAC|nr:hypothetical protein LAZ67_16001087 [Cordylochernes scorpioides]
MEEGVCNLILHNVLWQHDMGQQQINNIDGFGNNLDHNTMADILTSKRFTGDLRIVLGRPAQANEFPFMDTATFSQISAQESTIALKTFKSSLNRMKRSSLISTEEHKSFTTNLPNGTYIYGLPKVHKPSVPLRPIIAYHLSPAYPLAKYLSNYLSPLLNNNRSNLTVSSTPTLIQEITGLHPPKLHHVLPHHLIIDSLNQFLVSINTDPVKTNSITSLSQICLNMSTFTFDHIHFKQIRGSPMGSPLSSIAAELVMTRIDKWVCNLHCDDILFWRRYVDDILCICKTDLEETILSTLNSYNPNLSTGHIIPFLDILIIRTPASFHTTVYYKNSSTPTYTHFNSFCPIVHKINIVKTLTRRLHTHCSLPIFKTTEKARIISHLTAASYPLTFINKHTYSPAPSNPPPVFRTTCMLPYSPLTVSISRLIRPFGIRTFFINTPNIHSLLRHPITKTGTQLSPLDSSGAVYSVSCEHCSATYVGETGRTVAIRMSEHTRNINNNDPRSLIYQHVASTGHSFNTNHPTIHYSNIPNLHQRLMRGKKAAPAKSFSAFAGTINRDGPGTKMTFSDVKPHPGYGDDNAHDVAVLTLTEPVNMSSSVTTLCLCGPGCELGTERKDTALGWGQRSTAIVHFYIAFLSLRKSQRMSEWYRTIWMVLVIPEASPVLMTADTPNLPMDWCQMVYEGMGISVHTEKHVCSGGFMNGACYGDSGSPLVRRNNGTEFVAIGVTSFGSYLGCAFPGVPAVYTSVPYETKWIVENAAGADICVR